MSSGPGAPESFDERARKISQRLLRDRIVFLGTPIDGFIAKTAISQILMLTKESRKAISLYVNSPGGYVGDSLAIYDTMRQSPVDVSTVCIGQASGMAALLVAAGTPGQRLCLPGARFMLVPLGGGKDTDPQQLAALRVKVFSLFAACTGQTLEKVAKDSESEVALCAEEAVQYGLVDAVVETLRDLPGNP